jgi:broad specificity phosphatase PhoE
MSKASNKAIGMKCIIVKQKTNRIVHLLRALLISQVAVSSSSSSSLSLERSKLPKMKVDLYFVRHGETEANRDNVLQGHCDFPLTDRGVKQCGEVGEALQSMNWAKVFSSDLPRTLRTSQILLSKSKNYNPKGKEKLREDVRLREVNFGVKEMLPRDTTFEAAVEIVAKREGIRREDVVDNTETSAELKIRQHRFLTETLYPELKSICSKADSSKTAAPTDVESKLDGILGRESSNPKILCVSHGGFIRRFLSNYCDLDYVLSPENDNYPGASILSSVFGIRSQKLIRLSNCSISVVTVEWAEGAPEDGYVCTASADNVNIISHLTE